MARQVSMKHVSETELKDAYEALGLYVEYGLELSKTLLERAGKLFHPAIQQNDPSTALAIINELVINLHASGGLAGLKNFLEQGKVPSVLDIAGGDYFLLRQDINFSVRPDGAGNNKLRKLVETPIDELTSKMLLQGTTFIPKFGKKTAAQLLAISLIYETIKHFSPMALHRNTPTHKPYPPQTFDKR